MSHRCCGPLWFSLTHGSVPLSIPCAAQRSRCSVLYSVLFPAQYDVRCDSSPPHYGHSGEQPKPSTLYCGVPLVHRSAIRSSVASCSLRSHLGKHALDSAAAYPSELRCTLCCIARCVLQSIEHLLWRTSTFSVCSSCCAAAPPACYAPPVMLTGTTVDRLRVVFCTAVRAYAVVRIERCARRIASVVVRCMSTARLRS
jgi:hypothetical protein